MGTITNDEAVLVANDVKKRLGGRDVLNGASLEMRRGEIVGIVGENGAGKSTLLKILMGLLAPDSGRIVSDGLVGYCPQETIIFEALTVGENFQYFATAYGLNRDSSWEAEKNRLLDHFDFGQSAERIVSHLSGGTKQKLNLSLSLLHSPDILILDEPYSGFDWETYLRFWEYTDRMREGKRSILIVSHMVSDRARFDRIYDLKKGVLICG